MQSLNVNTRDMASFEIYHIQHFVCMNQLKNSQKEVIDYPFFYKDSSIISNHLKKLDEKDNLSDTSEIVNSKNTKDIYQKYLEPFYKIDDKLNQRIITQLEEENQSLFQMTKSQQQKIERLEEQLYEISGGRLFL